MLPASYGNPGPRYKISFTLPAGPRRVADGGARPRFNIATLGKTEGPPTRPNIRLHRCRTILVVKLDFIGDWVLTTPFLENLRRNAPQAEITAVVLGRVYELAATCPYLDRTISVSRADGRRLVFAAASVEALSTFRCDYLGRRFDVALVPRWDADFNGALHVAFGSRAPAIVGFSERSMARRASLNRGDDRFYTHAIVDRRLVHEADRDLALVEAMGGRVFAAGVRADFTAADAVGADLFLEKALKRTDRFLAVAPFASKGRSTLPPERLALVLRRLAQTSGLDIIVIGGPRETDRAAVFAQEIGHKAVSAAGVLGLRASAALIARASAFVGMDSGPAHIAAAVGTPVAVLSCHPAGAAPDHANAPERFAPRGRSEVVVIRPARATPPCRDGCDADDAHCILALDETTLWKGLSDFIGKVAGKRLTKPNRRGPKSSVRPRRSPGDDEVHAT